MTAWSTTPAIRRWSSPLRIAPASAASSSSSSSRVTRGTNAGRRLARVLGEQLLGELGHHHRRRVLCHPRRRSRPDGTPGSTRDEGAQPLERVVDALDGGGEVGRGGAHGLLEQGEQQLVLAGEVLVEAPQRLARALDDLLDGELLARATSLISSRAASRKRWTRFSARTRAGSSDRATACSRQLVGRRVGGHGRRRLISAMLPVDPLEGRSPEMRVALLPRQTAGSTTTSMVAAPLSGTRGWRHTSTGNETLTSE